jgi:hypothetical protein
LFDCFSYVQIHTSKQQTKDNKVQKLTIAKKVNGHFDYTGHTFVFTYKSHKSGLIRAVGYLYFLKDENQIYVLKENDCIKSNYSDSDRNESERLMAATPVNSGDCVEVNGETYKVQILGNYSDAGRLHKL